MHFTGMEGSATGETGPLMVCVHCGHSAKSVYVEYSPGNIRLTTCVRSLFVLISCPSSCHRNAAILIFITAVEHISLALVIMGFLYQIIRLCVLSKQLFCGCCRQAVNLQWTSMSSTKLWYSSLPSPRLIWQWL